MEDSDSESASSLLESIAAGSDKSWGGEYQDDAFEDENSADASLRASLGRDDGSAAVVDEEAAYEDESFEDEGADDAAGGTNSSPAGSSSDTEQLIPLDLHAGNGDASPDNASNSVLYDYEDDDFEHEEGDEAEVPRAVESIIDALAHESSCGSVELHDPRDQVNDAAQTDDRCANSVKPSTAEIVKATMLRRWCEQKTVVLYAATRSREAASTHHGGRAHTPFKALLPSPPSHAPANAAAVTKLIENARANRDGNHTQQLPAPRRFRHDSRAQAAKHTAVSTPLLDRAKTGRFVATATRLHGRSVEKENTLPATNRPYGKSNQPRASKPSISTFCSVKTADLRGKLATASLDDACAKWMQPSVRADDGTDTAAREFVSVGTLQMMR